MKACRNLLPLLLLVVALAGAALCSPAAVLAGTVSGQIMIDAKTPMRNGVVLLYNSYSGPPPSPYKYWRIPDQAYPAGKDGKFSLTLPAGDWYMMIAQKKENVDIGPPLESESLYFHADAAGNARSISVPEEGKVDLGKLTGTITWLPTMSERDKGITSIEGVVLTLEGKPVPNLVVLAYYTPETRRRPAFVSERTDKEGKFLIRVAEGGDYWLKVRGVIGGGAPAAGEFQNATDDFVPLMVSLADSQKLTGVTLNVREFDGIGSTGKPKLEKVWKRVNDLKGESLPEQPPEKKKKSRQ